MSGAGRLASAEIWPASCEEEERLAPAETRQRITPAVETSVPRIWVAVREERVKNLKQVCARDASDLSPSRISCEVTDSWGEEN